MANAMLLGVAAALALVSCGKCDAVDTEAWAQVQVLDATSGAPIAQPSFAVDGAPVSSSDVTCEVFADATASCSAWHVPVGDGPHTLDVSAPGHAPVSMSVDTGRLGGSGPCANVAAHHAELTVRLASS